MNGIIRKKSITNYGACGVVRGRDFEDRHPVIAGVIVLIAMVIAVAIGMVVF